MRPVFLALSWVLFEFKEAVNHIKTPKQHLDRVGIDW